MDLVSVRERFTAALDSLVEQVRSDRSVLAAILCGSLAARNATRAMAESAIRARRTPRRNSNF